MTFLLLITTLVAASAIGLAVGWKLSLVCISTIPLLLACGYFRLAMLVTFQKEKKKVHEESASYACEATSAIRTVAFLTREDDVWNHYHEQLPRTKPPVSCIDSEVIRTLCCISISSVSLHGARLLVWRYLVWQT